MESSSNGSKKALPPRTKNHLFRFWGHHFRFLKPELERETLPPFDRHASIKQAISRIEGRSIDTRINDRHKGVVDLLLAELRLMNAGIQDDFNASLSSIMRNIEKKSRHNAASVNKKKTDGGLFATSVAEGEEETADGDGEVESITNVNRDQDHLQEGVVKVSMLSELSSFVDDDDDDDHWSEQENNNQNNNCKMQQDMKEDSLVTADDSMSRDSLRKTLDMVPQLDAEALEDFQTALRNIQIFYTNYSNDTNAIHAPILEERVTQSPRSQYINSQRQAHNVVDVSMGITAYQVEDLDANSMTTPSVHQQQSMHLDSLSSLSMLEPSVEIGFSQQHKPSLVENTDAHIVSSVVENLPSTLSCIRSQLVAQQAQEKEIENAENYMEVQHQHIKDEDLDLAFWQVNKDKGSSGVDKHELSDDGNVVGKEKNNKRGRPALTSSQPPGAVVSFASGDTELKRPSAAASGEELKQRQEAAPPNMTARTIRSPRAVHAISVHQNEQNQLTEKSAVLEAPKTTKLAIKSRIVANTDKLKGLTKSIVAMAATNSVKFRKHAKKVKEDLQKLPIRESFAAYTKAQAAREPLFMKDKKL